MDWFFSIPFDKMAGIGMAAAIGAAVASAAGAALALWRNRDRLSANARTIEVVVEGNRLHLSLSMTAEEIGKRVLAASPRA